MVFPDFTEPSYQVAVTMLPSHALASYELLGALPYELPEGGWRLHSVIASPGVFGLYLVLIRVVPGVPKEPKWSQQDVDELALALAIADDGTAGLQEDRPLALRLLAAGYRKVAPRA